MNMHKTGKRFGFLTATVIVTLVLYSFVFVTTSASAAHATSKSSVGQAHSFRLGLHQLGSHHAMSAFAPQVSGSLQTWSSSFSFQGTTYPYTMVGTNPRSGSQTTTVPVDIIPLVFTFSDGTSLDGTSVVSTITNSALFHSASFVTGHTQYLDAIQRGEFWSTVSSKSTGYHVLLGTPAVRPTVTLNVPSSSGYAEQDYNGNTIGLVDINWFSPVADQLATNNNAPSHLVVFAAVNIYQYQGDPSQCCIGGYHTAVQSGGNTYTYAYAAYDQAADVFHDIDALSHEVAEWGNDPFVNNTTPNWYASNYGCSNVLEVGDPAVGTDFTVNGLDFQDEVYFSWFARQSPSQGYHGRYDYLGTLYHSPASGC